MRLRIRMNELCSWSLETRTMSVPSKIKKQISHSIRAALRLPNVADATRATFTLLLSEPGRVFVQRNPKFAMTVRQKLCEFYVYDCVLSARPFHIHYFGYDFRTEDVQHCNTRVGSMCSKNALEVDAFFQQCLVA